MRVVGEQLEQNGISFVYAHNSGAFQIMDLPSKNKTRSGLTFEMFDNCVEDLQAYVDFAKEQGYKKIILGGHSYGCNKVVYYLYKTSAKTLTGIFYSLQRTLNIILKARKSLLRNLIIILRRIIQNKTIFFLFCLIATIFILPKVIWIL